MRGPFRASSLAIVLGILAWLATADEAAAMNCDTYAANAVMHQQNNILWNCNYSGDRWHENSGSHKLWCTFANPRQRNFEHKAREDLLDKCQLKVVPGQVQVVPDPKAAPGGSSNQGSQNNNAAPARPASGVSGQWCNDWAHNVADLAAHYASIGCIVSGDNTHTALYNYCWTEPQRSSIEARKNDMHTEGNACNRARNSGSSSGGQSGGNAYEHCVAYTREAWAVTQEALRICRNQLSVPTTQSGIHDECMQAGAGWAANDLPGWSSGRMGLLQNITNTCDRR